jgi:hypothetical protein
LSNLVKPNSSVDYAGSMSHLKKIPIVALVTTGRTGSDFLQSLLDSHPQIATFNGHFAVYSEFFSRAVTFSVPNALIEDAADEFIGQYLYKLVSRYDIQEAKDSLGSDSTQSFRIDTRQFKEHILGLMGGSLLTSHDFLLAIYGAYNLCLGQKLEDCRVIFHHPHLDYEFKLFIQDFPNVRVIFSSRDPRANFCSHVEHFRLYYKTHDNEAHIFNCLKMMLEDSLLADEFGLDYTAVRLEDLPREDVIRELATWLGVDYIDSMLRSTWAGLDWHGDRISSKRFPATGWTKNRTDNGWQERLGYIEKRVLNFIMHDRLHWYQYAVKSINFVDMVVVAIFILLPFRCERRLLSLTHMKEVWQSKSRVRQVQYLLTPLFFIRRIALCYQYYWRTCNRMPFKRNWLRGCAAKTIP